MRVFELARELNVSNQEVIAQLRELGVDVTNHMSSVDEGQARKVRQTFAPEEAVKKDTQDERIKKTVIRRRVVRRKGGAKQDAEGADEAAEADGAEAADGQATDEPAEAIAAAEGAAAEAAEATADETEAADEAEEAAEAADEASPAKAKKGAARIVDRIQPPPPPQEPGGAPGRGGDEGRPSRPKRRIVAKRMYRPSKAEEKKLAKIRQSRQRKKGEPGGETQPIKAEKRRIRIEETITVGDLAKAMGVKTGEVIKKFIEMGMMVTINQAVDPETAGVIATDYGYEVEQVGFQEQEHLPVTGEDSPEDLIGRPPVVTVMGHVDHGKTSILDALRKTRVAAGEAGGITQHIGAYQVETDRGLVTFIDTPGHEAFTAMRARGAEVTDIVVLVVAADDGVMPQTAEAINHAKAAGVPIVVAVNKCDLPDAQPERIRQQLTEYELVPEAWGGDTQMIDVSAKTGENLEALLESIALQAEVMELKANPNKPASGVVVEGRLDKGRGAVATVIVQDGTMRPGDIVVTGVTSGRLRAMLSDTGQQLAEAPPSTPVEILGMSDVPQAGEQFAVVRDEKIARQIAANRERKERERELHAQSAVSLENIYDRMQGGEVQELAVVLKADVQGSMEAVRDSLERLSKQDEAVRIKIVASGVGGITENDVNLAAASDAVVIGFNTRPDSKASRSSQEFGVEIRVYNIIYDLIDDLKKSLEGMLAPAHKEESLGWAKVLETFPIKGIGTVAGCKVESGKVERGQGLRLVRDGQVLYDGKLANLRRFENDVAEVPNGQECGILLENFNKVQIGDELECYKTVEVERVLGETV